MNQKPNKLKYRWWDLTLEKLLSLWQLFGHILPEALCCHPAGGGQLMQVSSKLLWFFEEKNTRKSKKAWMIFNAKCFKACFLWLVCCCFNVIFKNCSTNKLLVHYLLCLPYCSWQKDIQSLLCKLDTCMQTTPKHFWHDRSSDPKYVCNLFHL